VHYEKKGKCALGKKASVPEEKKAILLLEKKQDATEIAPCLVLPCLILLTQLHQPPSGVFIN